MADLKTTRPNERTGGNYSRQLHVYETCIENADPMSLTFAPVSRLGMVVFKPTAFRLSAEERSPGLNAFLGGSMSWVEVELDDGGVRGVSLGGCGRAEAYRSARASNEMCGLRSRGQA